MRAAEAHFLAGGPLCHPSAIQALSSHAVASYPQECVGYIDSAGLYVPMVNIAPDPKRHAMASPKVIGPLLHAGQVRAFCHSHPDGPDCPSAQDMATQQEMEVPFILLSTNGQACTHAFAWGDQLADERDIVGRGFLHGVDDCYAMIRAWFLRERGITLPDYPRDWEWWLRDQDLYQRFFAEAGFHEIDRSEVVPGDCWLAAVRSPVPNHAGIYLDGGLALHHPSSGLPNDPQRLSKRESLARWQPFITHWVRRP